MHILHRPTCLARGVEKLYKESRYDRLGVVIVVVGVVVVVVLFLVIGRCW
jgi:hypothetical protein